MCLCHQITTHGQKNTKKHTFEQKTTRPKKGNEGQAPKPCKNNFNGFQKNFGKKKIGTLQQPNLFGIKPKHLQ